MPAPQQRPQTSIISDTRGSPDIFILYQGKRRFVVKDNVSVRRENNQRLITIITNRADHVLGCVNRGHGALRPKPVLNEAGTSVFVASWGWHLCKCPQES